MILCHKFANDDVSFQAACLETRVCREASIVLRRGTFSWHKLYVNFGSVEYFIDVLLYFFLRDHISRSLKNQNISLPYLRENLYSQIKRGMFCDKDDE